MNNLRATHTTFQRQRGAALLVMLVVLIIGTAAFLISSLSSTAIKVKHDQISANSLALTKDALIGDAISQLPVADAGFLRLPDLGFAIGPVPAEGNSAPNFAGNNKDYSVIGKIPWRTLGISPPLDGQQECLWYVVSGRFKKTSAATTTDVFNWDTLGQIDVIDGNGTVIANNLAALIVAPGLPRDGQSHALADATYSQCSGNYDVQNYLDSFNLADAVAGEINYFPGSTNNRVALNTNNKKFVMASNDHYNDQFLFVTADDIFHPIMRRSDFRDQIRDLLDDPDVLSQVETGLPGTVAVSGAGTKGADNINCGAITNADTQKFCKNWKDMLLLTNIPGGPESITIDEAATAPCNRVLIFGGQKIGAQVRVTAANKADPNNYLEGVNSASFATPTANNDNFNGRSTFDFNNPSTDLLRCLP